MDFLLSTIKFTISKAKVNELTKIAAEEGFSIKELIDLTFHQDDQIGFRASWILENVYINYVDRFLPYAVYFLSTFQQQDNLSSRRCFSKILALMTARKAPQSIKAIVESYETAGLVDTVFGWLIDEQVPVAIKSHGLNILANLSSKHNWIKNELLETMDFLIDKESIAFYAKVKQVRKQLA